MILINLSLYNRRITPTMDTTPVCISLVFAYTATAYLCCLLETEFQHHAHTKAALEKAQTTLEVQNVIISYCKEKTPCLGPLLKKLNNNELVLLCDHEGIPTRNATDDNDLFNCYISKF